MGATGAIIMGFFGAVFAAMTMAWQQHVAGPALLIPFVIFAVIAGFAWMVLRAPGQGITPTPAVRRAIMWSSIGEGIGLFITSNIVINLHRPAWLLPAMALVVGLHFLPIARAAAFGPFYTLATALLVAAAAGFSLPSPTGGEIAGFAAALSLWVAAVMAVWRDGRAKRLSHLAG